MKSISAHDIVLLAETHLGYSDNVQIDGFHYFPICRPMSSHNRHFGGLAILSKINIKNGVKILPICNTNFQWIQLRKEFFNLRKDLFICTVYYPPRSSTYLNSDNSEVFELLEKDIFMYQNLGHIIICGDFNARCGGENDYVTDDLDNFIPINSSYIAGYSKGRQSRDIKIDTRCKELLDFCIGNKLRILNGRVLGDTCGNYTCFNVHGQSVVDHALASDEILGQILFLKFRNSILYYQTPIVKSLFVYLHHILKVIMLMPLGLCPNSMFGGRVLMTNLSSVLLMQALHRNC